MLQKYIKIYIFGNFLLLFDFIIIYKCKRRCVMTNPINYQNQTIPGYSGITINITNPTMHAGGVNKCTTCDSLPEGEVVSTIEQPATPISEPQANYIADRAMTSPINQPKVPAEIEALQSKTTEIQPTESKMTDYVNSKDGIPQAYPPQYYLNNYNYIQNEQRKNGQIAGSEQESGIANQNTSLTDTAQPPEENLDSSKEIISDLDARSAAQKDLEKNGKQTRVIALTNEYIMSLENYLNNPNSEIRLMAAKEVLTRLDEDKNRYDDAALNALLNKMLQDPNKLIRIAALSAFSSQLASGNDYTVELLTNIQNDPNADKEDVVQAADCLLKMSSSSEIKYTPVKNKENKSKNKDSDDSQKQIDQLKTQLQKYKDKEVEQMLQQQLPQGK